MNKETSRNSKTTMTKFTNLLPLLLPLLCCCWEHVGTFATATFVVTNNGGAKTGAAGGIRGGSRRKLEDEDDEVVQVEIDVEVDVVEKS